MDCTINLPDEERRVVVRALKERSTLGGKEGRIAWEVAERLSDGMCTKMKTESKKVTAYICGTAAGWEVGETDFHVYPSALACRASEPCTDECGVVEVQVEIGAYVHHRSQPKGVPFQTFEEQKLVNHILYEMSIYGDCTDDEKIAALTRALAVFKRMERRRNEIEASLSSVK